MLVVLAGRVGRGPTRPVGNNAPPRPIFWGRQGQQMITREPRLRRGSRLAASCDRTLLVSEPPHPDHKEDHGEPEQHACLGQDIHKPQTAHR